MTHSATPTIDIMMPFYGDIGYFKLAVQSVLAQSDPDWKLTIIDDLYPDLSAGHWAGSLEDSRVSYQRNGENLGVAGNFAKCVELATAEFVVIMGCDDLLLPGFVAQMKKLAVDFPAASFIQPGVHVIDERGAVVLPLADRVKKFYRPTTARPTLMDGQAYAVSVLRGNWTYFPSIAWRTRVIKSVKFRTDLDVVLDLALQIDILAAGGKVCVDAQNAVYEYRRHFGSVSAWTAGDGTRFEEESRYFLEAAQTMRELGWHRAAHAAKMHYSSRLNELTSVPRALRGGGVGVALRLLRHALSFTSAPKRA